MMKRKRLRLTLAGGGYGFTQAREGMRNFLLQTFPLNMYVSQTLFRKHFFVARANVSDIQERERASEREVCSGSGTDH